MPEPAIEIRSLTKRFGHKTALDGISLAVPRGQVFGYIGPNGAGKTTTVKILVGMLGGYEGQALVCGRDVDREPLEVKRRIGYLPEHAQLYEALTPLEHLRLVGRLHGLSDELIDHRGVTILEQFELGSRVDSRIGSLSKGMRQKVMIAAALLHDPEVLFLDEPLSGLDVYTTVLIKELLRELAARGKTILYCSHMMDVVERVCDRIAIIDGGRIVAAGTFAELDARAGAGKTLEHVFLELTAGGGESARARSILACFRGAEPDGAA